MIEQEPLALARARETGELLRDAFSIYLRNFPVIFAIGAAIVIPVQLIVSGIGLEQLTGSYGQSGSRGELLIPTAVSYLVVAPLIAAATIRVLQDLAAGERPHAGRSIQSGLDAFGALFLAILLAGLGVALGLLLLIIPGIFIAVRWFFVPQAVVIDGARGTDSLRQSAALTQGFWWRTLGIALLANIVAFVPGGLIMAPVGALAQSADQQAIYLGGTILAEVITAPFVALVSTLLFFDIRARRAGGPTA